MTISDLQRSTTSAGLAIDGVKRVGRAGLGPMNVSNSSKEGGGMQQLVGRRKGRSNMSRMART